MNITWREAKQRAPKTKDCWSRKIISDPLMIPLAYLLVKYTNIKPLTITVVSFCLGIVAAIFFCTGEFLVGAIIYFSHFLVDALDGKLSRLRREDDTYRGAWDFLGDGIVDFCVVLSIALYADFTLLLLLAALLGIFYLITRFTSLSYRLMQIGNISNSRFAEPDMLKNYKKNILISTYYRIDKKLNRYSFNLLPSAAETSLVGFCIGPILWSLTENIIYMYWCIGIGILILGPVVLGTGVIAVSLAGRNNN